MACFAYMKMAVSPCVSGGLIIASLLLQTMSQVSAHLTVILMIFFFKMALESVTWNSADDILVLRKCTERYKRPADLWMSQQYLLCAAETVLCHSFLTCA